jgi:hypothetical protein
VPGLQSSRSTVLVLYALTFSIAAQSATVKIHCGASASGINSALSRLNPIGPNTLIVSGTCSENVVVQGFDRLTLQAAQSGATINDISGGNNPTVAILD